MGRLSSIRRRFSVPWGTWKISGEVTAADEIPTQIPRRRAVLVRSGGKVRWIAFDCPCGRGHRLMLNLDEVRRPRWRLKSTAPLTIDPSIDDAVAGRRCHFFIRNGRIKWAKERREPRA